MVQRKQRVSLVAGELVVVLIWHQIPHSRFGQLDYLWHRISFNTILSLPPEAAQKGIEYGQPSSLSIYSLDLFIQMTKPIKDVKIKAP